MIDMLAVSSAINQAKIDLSFSPEGILSLASRTAIWIAMDDHADSEASYFNRTNLKVLCVNKVKSIWTQMFPTDSSIDNMLQLTYALMGKSVDPGTAENDASRFLQNAIAKIGSNATTDPALMVADAAAARELVSSEEVKAAIVPDPGNPIGLKLIALNDPPSSLVMKLSVAPDVELLNPDAPNPSFQYLLNLGFGMVWLIAAITFGMSIAQSVVEEKQTRIVEILLASVPSKALLTGKILGNSAAALVQIAAIAGTVFLGAAINGGSIPLAELTIPILWFIVLFLFGFVMIASLHAAAAALVSRSEDLNNAVQPLIWLVMLPYFGVSFAGNNPLVLQIMSYIPLSAPVAVPLRIFREQGAAWEPFLSIVILIATTALVIWFAARIYDRGLLRTGKPMKWKEALKATD